MDKNIEYTMLKQEIINISDIIVNIALNMYVISITIFGFALQFKNYYLYLLPYLILIPFQSMINRKRDGINRIAAYIAVYLEEGDGWESNYKRILFATKNLTKKKMLRERMTNFVIGQSGSTQLGLLSTGFFLIAYVPTINMDKVTLTNCIWVGISIILCIILYMLNKKILYNMKSRNEYIRQLKSVKNKEKKY